MDLFFFEAVFVVSGFLGGLPKAKDGNREVAFREAEINAQLFGEVAVLFDAGP